MSENQQLKQKQLAIERLIARYAPTRNREQLSGLCIRCSEQVAICFDSSPDRVTQIIMSYLYVDPNQGKLL